MSTDITVDMNRELALALNERIRVNGRILATTILELGKDLRRMKVEKLYTYLGYEDFETYAEQEHELKLRAAYNYITVYEKLGEEFVQSNAQLGITKLLELTQIDAEDRNEIVKENDLEGMTVNEVKELVAKYKQQGEQLSMLEEKTEADKVTRENLEEQLEILRYEREKAMKEAEALRSERDKLAEEVEELEARPVDVTVPEPEIKEVIKEIIKEVPDEKAIAARDSEIEHLHKKYKELEKSSKSEIESLKTEYEDKLAKVKSASDADKSSFKAMYAEAYKSFSGLVEFIKSAEEKDKNIFIDRTKVLITAVSETLEKI